MFINRFCFIKLIQLFTFLFVFNNLITLSLQSIVILHHWLHCDNHYTEYFVDLICSFLFYQNFCVFVVLLLDDFIISFSNFHSLSLFEYFFCLFFTITFANQFVKIFQKVFYILFVKKFFTFCLSTSSRQTISIWRSRTILFCHQNFSTLFFNLTFFVKSIIDTFQLFQTNYDSFLTSSFSQIFDQL